MKSQLDKEYSCTLGNIVGNCILSCLINGNFSMSYLHSIIPSELFSDIIL